MHRTLLSVLITASVALAAPQSPVNRLHALAGEWVVLDSGGEATELRARYEVMANGHAVVETMLVDTVEEVVTTYYADGEALGR